MTVYEKHNDKQSGVDSGINTGKDFAELSTALQRSNAHLLKEIEAITGVGPKLDRDQLSATEELCARFGGKILQKAHSDRIGSDAFYAGLFGDAPHAEALTNRRIAFDMKSIGSAGTAKMLSELSQTEECEHLYLQSRDHFIKSMFLSESPIESRQLARLARLEREMKDASGGDKSEKRSLDLAVAETNSSLVALFPVCDQKRAVAVKEAEIHAIAQPKSQAP